MAFASTPGPTPGNNPSIFVAPTREELGQAAQRAVQGGRIGLPTLYTDDLSYLTDKFLNQSTILRDLGRDCPLVSVDNDDPAPLDIYASGLDSDNQVANGTLASLPGSQLSSVISDAIDMARNAGFTINYSSIDYALNYFKQNLEFDLIHRADSASGNIGGGVFGSVGSVSVPGLSLRVTSKTNGLKILYYPKLFCSTQTVFGNSLSSPVDSYVTPSTYIFGGVSGVNAPRFETNSPYRVPPTQVVNLVTM